MANLFSEKLELCVSEQMEKGLDKINAKEMGEVVDMIKDSYEIEKLKAEKRYYDSVVNAMEDSEHEREDWYDDRGYPTRRDSRGRFMSGGSRSRSSRMGYEAYAHRPEDMTRDMYTDYDDKRRMPNLSRYGFSHDEYMDKRKEYPMTDPEGAKHRKQLLNDYMDDMYDMAKEMVQDMSQEEKQMWKAKLAQISAM